MPKPKVKLTITRVAGNSPVVSVLVAQAVAVDARLFKVRQQDTGAEPVYMGVCSPSELLTLPTVGKTPGDYFRTARTLLKCQNELDLQAAIGKVSAAIDALLTALSTVKMETRTIDIGG